MNESGKTKVLYIGGYSRSGSTLLLRLLGELPGFIAVGELFDIWERSYIENQLCGCGKGFNQCEFWSEVTAKVFGCKPEDVPATRLNKQRSEVQGYKRIPALWLPAFRSRKYRHELHDYAALLQRLYEAVNSVAGSHIIVDSSKVPQYAWILAEAAGIELHMVHLIRDSRATAFSWQRQRVRPEVTSRKAYMDRHSIARSAIEWNLFNYLVRSRSRRYASYTVMRYEDLVGNCAVELQRVADAMGEALPHLQDQYGPSLTLGFSHTASGNPSRFEGGEIRLSRDEEWINAMRGRARLVVTVLTALGLARYGYPLLARRDSEAPRALLRRLS